MHTMKVKSLLFFCNCNRIMLRKRKVTEMQYVQSIMRIQTIIYCFLMQILMLNINKETQKIVPQVARLLIRIYLISILPITFWTTIFAVFTGVELA